MRVLKLKSARDLQPSFAETASASRRQHTVHTRGPSREANAFCWLAELGHLEIEFVNCISIIAKTRSRIVWRALARCLDAMRTKCVLRDLLASKPCAHAHSSAIHTL